MGITSCRLLTLGRRRSCVDYQANEEADIDLYHIKRLVYYCLVNIK